MAEGQHQALQGFILDPDLGRLEDLLAEFNLFDVLGIERREVLHSAFLAWLLDPRGSHRLGDYFLRRFLSEAAAEAGNREVPHFKATPFDIDRWSLSDIEVATERHRIDILLVGKSDGFVCLVENKIGGSEHSGQLGGYLETVEEEYAGLDPFPIFLTPDGREPDAERYVPLGYQKVAKLIARVLEMRGPTISDSVASFLKQYADTLGRHVLETTDKTNDIDDLAYRIYDKHKSAIDTINKVRSDNAGSARAKVLKIIESVVDEHARDLKSHSKSNTTRQFRSRSLEEISELKEGVSRGCLLLFDFVRANKGNYILVYPKPLDKPSTDGYNNGIKQTRNCRYERSEEGTWKVIPQGYRSRQGRAGVRG